VILLLLELLLLPSLDQLETLLLELLLLLSLDLQEM